MKKLYNIFFLIAYGLLVLNITQVQAMRNPEFYDYIHATNHDHLKEYQRSKKIQSNKEDLYKRSAQWEEYNDLAMFSFVKSGEIRPIKKFLKNWGNVNQVDENGMTMLMHAVIVGNIDIVQLLISYDAKVDLLDYKCRNALMLANLYGRDSCDQNEIINLLLDLTNKTEVSQEDV